MFKTIKSITLGCLLISIVSCTYIPFFDVRPIYVDPRSGRWTNQQPTSEQVAAATQDSTSFLLLWGPKYYPGIDYTEPIALGYYQELRPIEELNRNALNVLQPPPGNLCVTQACFNAPYKNPSLTNPKALICTPGPATTAGPLLIICR
jgi:hypothetical protein